MTNIRNTAHFCSGGGTTFNHVADMANGGELGAIRSRVMIASKDEIGAILKAETQGIDVEVLNDTKNADEIIRILERYGINDVVLNGYLPKYPKEAVDYITGKGGVSLNQHPGPIRENGFDFGGAEKGMGMFGSRVTAARVLYLLATSQAGAKGQFTESTVQYVGDRIDSGKVVGIERLDISNILNGFRGAWEDMVGDKTPREIDFTNDEHPGVIGLKSLVENRIQPELLPLEHQNVAKVMKQIGNGVQLQVSPEYGEILVSESESHTFLLEEAKRNAVILFPNG